MHALTWQEVLIAAILAKVVIWLLKTVSSLFRAVITRSTEFEFSKKNEDDVIERCYEMFPTEHVFFNGTNFKRGMRVCVITLRQRRYEGRFIGINHDNMMCVMTDRSVVAQELATVEEMIIM